MVEMRELELTEVAPDTFRVTKQSHRGREFTSAPSSAYVADNGVRLEPGSHPEFWCNQRVMFVCGYDKQSDDLKVTIPTEHRNDVIAAVLAYGAAFGVGRVVLLDGTVHEQVRMSGTPAGQTLLKRGDVVRLKLDVKLHFYTAHVSYLANSFATVESVFDNGKWACVRVVGANVCINMLAAGLARSSPEEAAEVAKAQAEPDVGPVAAPRVIPPKFKIGDRVRLTEKAMARDEAFGGRSLINTTMGVVTEMEGERSDPVTIKSGEITARYWAGDLELAPDAELVADRRTQSTPTSTPKFKVGDHVRIGMGLTVGTGVVTRVGRAHVGEGHLFHIQANASVDEAQRKWIANGPFHGDYLTLVDEPKVFNHVVAVEPKLNYAWYAKTTLDRAQRLAAFSTLLDELQRAATFEGSAKTEPERVGHGCNVYSAIGAAQDMVDHLWGIRIVKGAAEGHCRETNDIGKLVAHMRDEATAHGACRGCIQHSPCPHLEKANAAKKEVLRIYAAKLEQEDRHVQTGGVS
jgi:hypothetical protein